MDVSIKNQQLAFDDDPRVAIGKWLSSAFFVEEGLRFDKVNDGLINYIEKVLEESNIKNRYMGTSPIEFGMSFITNLVRAYRAGVPLVVPLSGCYWPDTYLYGRKRIKKLLAALQKRKIVEVKKGYQGTNRFNGYHTRVWLTDSGYSSINTYLDDLVGFTEERGGKPLVSIKERGSSRWYRADEISEKELETIEKDLYFLNNYNELVHDSVITLEIPKNIRKKYKERLNYLERIGYIKLIKIFGGDKKYIYRLAFRYMTRRYLNDTKHGGRFYNTTVQSLSSELRKYLVIDGKKTIEIDFNSLHINMLYHMEGKVPPSNPYIYTGTKRKIVKKVGLIAINARNRRATTGASKKHFNENDISFNVKEILDEFLEHNKEIKKYLCSDIGIKLQYLDSTIMKKILEKCIKKKKIALSVHDSVIVQKEDKEYIINVMKAAYYSVMHASIEVSIKGF